MHGSVAFVLGKFTHPAYRPREASGSSPNANCPESSTTVSEPSIRRYTGVVTPLRTCTLSADDGAAPERICGGASSGTTASPTARVPLPPPETATSSTAYAPEGCGYANAPFVVPL